MFPTASSPSVPDHDAIIVGAGFGGMGAAIELDRLGLSDTVILEREDDLGGTWHVNRYPGLAVDIASMTYSYSFEPNPYWSRLFAPGAELKQYAEHVADKYRLRERMRFSTVVDAACWDEENSWWRVTTAAGEVYTGRYLVTATGFLSQPYTPPFAGIDDFTGRIVHTTDWPDDLDLTCRRVAIIGTGATSVQLVPEIGAVADELTVHQRTPIWVVPKPDFPIPRLMQRMFAAIPVTQRIGRAINTTILEALMVIGVLRFRQAKPLNRMAAVLGRVHLRLSVHDKQTRRALTPHYDFGCKRPTFSNKYFTAFNQRNVHLETSPIDHITSDAVVTVDGHARPIDTLVLATGFNIWDVNFPAFEVIGREGKNLGKWWRDARFQAYEGITMPMFPNMFSLNSPYSYSGLSYFTTIEAQMKHMARLLGEVRRRGARTFEVSEQANLEFLDHVTDRLGDSVFYAGRCASAHSYYFNQHSEAALLRPTSTITTHREASRFPLGDYLYS